MPHQGTVSPRRPTTTRAYRERRLPLQPNPQELFGNSDVTTTQWREGPRKTCMIAEARDETLVELARKGDRAAFGVLVTRYQALVSATAFGMAGNASDS